MERDELIETIREVIAEERRERMTHPEARERVTRYQDPTGKTWTSVTMAKAEWVTKILQLCLVVGAVLSLANVVVIRMSVGPLIDEKIGVAIHAHETAAEERMKAIAPTIATRSELDAVKSEMAVSRAQRIEQFNALNARLDRIENMLQILLKQR